MPLRIFKIYLFIFFLSFTFSGCKTHTDNDDYLVISSIYNHIPKFIPAPTDKQRDGGSQIKGIEHKYAINKYLLNERIKINTSGYFFKYKSDKLFDKTKLSNEEKDIVKKLGEEYKGEILDEVTLEEYLEEDIVVLNKKFIDFKDEGKYGINRILTFSKPLYNNDRNIAVLYIINYGGGLDAHQVVYLLRKINGKWEIKYYNTISIA